MSATNPLAGGCPVNHAGGAPRRKPNPLAGGCPVNHAGPAADARGPADGPDRRVAVRVDTTPKPMTKGDMIPEEFIPASGRGNSDDGKKWLNPSANQLYRALKRKNKPIESADSFGVAEVHTAVTDNTWRCIMEYENLHRSTCAKPTLSRFTGQDGNYSLKARMMHWLGNPLPFDRHDWVVDRCGREVTYIIDYYALPDDETGDTEYYIDARPTNFGGWVDRLRLGLKEWFG